MKLKDNDMVQIKVQCRQGNKNHSRSMAVYETTMDEVHSVVLQAILKYKPTNNYQKPVGMSYTVSGSAGRSVYCFYDIDEGMEFISKAIERHIDKEIKRIKR